MGGVVSIFRPRSAKQRAASLAAVSKADREKEAAARKLQAEKDKKKTTAFKLAQLMSGAGGVLSEAKTSKRKLLGN